MRGCSAIADAPRPNLHSEMRSQRRHSYLYHCSAPAVCTIELKRSKLTPQAGNLIDLPARLSPGSLSHCLDLNGAVTDIKENGELA